MTTSIPTQCRRAVVLALLSSSFAWGQIYTSPNGNSEVYSRKPASTQFGMLSTSVLVPLGGSGTFTELKQKGLIFCRQYSIGEFDPIVLSGSDQLQIAIDGALRIGGSLGSQANLIPWGPYTAATVKYYVAMIDLFSIELAPTYTHMFDNGTGIIAKIAVTAVNIGASAAVQDKSSFGESGILVANVLPVQVNASIAFDFGRSALGVSFFMNAGSILNYTHTPGDVYGDSYKGLLSSTLIKKMAIQIVFAN
jgi:hypothetical protein